MTSPVINTFDALDAATAAAIQARRERRLERKLCVNCAQ
jgi:hypothetical protein